MTTLADLAQVEREESRIKQVFERLAAKPASTRYSYFDCANLVFIQERERAILRMLRKSGRSNLADVRMLEVGCGGGFWLRQFIQWGCSPENVFGVDLVASHVERARRSLPAAVRVECGSGTRLTFADETLDLVLLSTVFSSILNRSVCREIASETFRVLKPGGAILWYDFYIGNPSNPDVRPIKKAEILDLFPHGKVRLQRITLAPPIARAVAPIAPGLVGILSHMKFLCTHYFGTVEKT
jgi:SAM-dependent methyltransferase